MEKLTIVKIGGKVINEEPQLDAFLQKFASLKGLKILVHGGGNIASEIQKKLNIPVQMIEGRRVTDKDAIEIVTMVFAGLNKKIAAKLQGLGVNAIGVSGTDLGLIKSKMRDKNPVDFGYVGDIEEINTDQFKFLLDKEVTAAVCALTHDGSGQLLNTNADTIASKIAVALGKDYAVDLVYCFEQSGVLSDFENKVVIPEITVERYQKYKQEGIISDGMIPKLDNAFAAIDAGVKHVKICHFDAVDLLQGDQYPGTTIC